jgi:succinyl-CoA synthetase beta subunit
MNKKQQELNRDIQETLDTISSELWKLYVKHGIKVTEINNLGYIDDRVLDMKFEKETLPYRRDSTVGSRRR